MAFSGTVGQTTIDLATLLEHAFRRCKVPPSLQTPENVSTALESLYFLIAELSVLGINLWCIEKIILGLHKYQEAYALPRGTVEALNVFLRESTRAGGTLSSSDAADATPLEDGDILTSVTQSLTGGNFKWQFAGSTAIRTFGMLHKGAASRSLVLEVSQDNVTWSTVRAVGAATYTDMEWIWLDIDPATAAMYFRVRDTLTSTAMAAYELLVSSSGEEVECSRLNRGDYLNLPDKFRSGRPLQFWYDRATPQPILRVWPSPDNIFNQYIVWRHRHVQDVGTDLTAELEIPIRWFEAVVSGLALKVSMEVPEVNPQIVPLLSAAADRALTRVEAEEVDWSDMTLRPAVYHYTKAR